MTITSAQLLFCLSGGAANSAPSASLGGTRSATTLSDATLNNLFDDVSAAEASSGDSEYRGIFLYLSTTETLSSPRVWVSASSTAAGDEIYIATDSGGMQISTNMTMTSVSNESTAPTGMGSWTGYGTTISLSGSMAPTGSVGAGYGLWIYRSVSVGASSYANNSATIAWDGETA